MNHVGTQRIETGRLILRRYALEDAQQIYDHWASDDEVTKYLTWPTHSSVEVTKAVLADWVPRYARPDIYHWGLELRETGELFGDIAVVHMIEPLAEAELGWCMGRPWWGKGYMPEAAEAVLKVLFDVGFNRVCATHDVNNPKSGRVMQKIGMTFEGIARQGGRNNQGFVDVARYAVLKSDIT